MCAGHLQSIARGANKHKRHLNVAKQKNDKLFFIQAKIKNSLTENPFTELKQYEDNDYDSFVSLTGRRDAAQPIGELSVL